MAKKHEICSASLSNQINIREHNSFIRSAKIYIMKISGVVNILIVCCGKILPF